MAMATKEGDRLLSTKRLKIGVDVGGAQAGVYQEIVGANAISYEEGSRSVKQVDFFGSTAAETGSKTVEPFTIGLGSLFDHMRVFRGLQAADHAGRTVDVRIEAYGYEIEPASTGITFAVAALGTANDPTNDEKIKGTELSITGSGADATRIKRGFLTNKYKIGDIIWFGSADPITPATNISEDAFIINRIEYDDADPTNTESTDFHIYVTPASGIGDYPGGTAKSGTASIRAHGRMREFTADVEQQGSESGDASGSPSFEGGIVFRPKSLITPPTLILYERAQSGW